MLESGDILALDASRSYLVVRNDFVVDASEEFAFSRAAWAVRIRGHFALAVPDPPKAIRRLTIA
jgi:hypothetical protein